MKPHRIIEGAEPVVGGDLGLPLTARSAAVDGLFYGIIAIAMASTMAQTRPMTGPVRPRRRRVGWAGVSFMVRASSL